MWWHSSSERRHAGKENKFFLLLYTLAGSFQDQAFSFGGGLLTYRLRRNKLDRIIRCVLLEETICDEFLGVLRQYDLVD